MPRAPESPVFAPTRLSNVSRLIAPLTAAAYPVLHLALHGHLGPATGALSLVPVALLAESYGMLAGLVAAFAIVPLNYLLIPAAVRPGVEVFLRSGAGPGLCIGIAMAVLAARVRETRARLREREAEKQAAHVALARSERYLATALDSLRDAVISTDAAQRVVWMNPAAERLTGWSRADALGRALNDVFRVEDAEAAGGATEAMPVGHRVLEDGRTHGLEIDGTLLARDGSRRPVAVSVSRIWADAVTTAGVIVVFRDTAAERRAREALRRSERELREMIDATPDGVAVLRDGRLVYANAAWAAAVRADPGTCQVGRPLGEMLAHEGRAEALAWLAAGGSPGAHLEARFAGPAGESILELSSPRTVRFDGAPAQLVLARDVTEHREMRTRLALADRMASLGTLAAGVAHEINNPIAFTLTNLEVLGEELDALHEALAPERQRALREALRDARDGAERVRGIVRDLKTFSRGNDETPGPVDLRTVAEAALKLTAAEMRPRARVVREFGAVPVVAASEARVAQVVVNLLVNAAHAIPEGAADRNEVRVKTFTDGRGRAVLEVRDTGVGMDASVLARVFDPFFTTKAAGLGTGLGLSICHGIVTGLGGEIAVESRPGAGSVFRVVLPAAERVRARAPEHELEPDTGVGPRARVLVIDDEAMVGTALRRALKGHQVTVVGSGPEALEVLRDGADFEVVFCDLSMPEMTGMDVYEAVRASWPGLAARMVFITGGAFTARAREFMARGERPLMEKPFDLEKLRRLVADYAARRMREAAAEAARG